jgi:hypothetical protein
MIDDDGWYGSLLLPLFVGMGRISMLNGFLLRPCVDRYLCIPV